MVELPLGPCVCIEIWNELIRERNNFHLTFEAERCTQDGLARKHPQQQWTSKRVPAGPPRARCGWVLLLLRRLSPAGSTGQTRHRLNRSQPNLSAIRPTCKSGEPC